ncbi:3,4-dihydroxy-2-butanone-4-phosphate synthase, partial [Pseudonocardia sp. NPDC049154]|uniref:3,4-dihydroxy-2-butanone-4-phosphate synthase n=1 Tax=Pseudonocardia sp. NPDC049154 TaxID=3155501 RepID=UPI0033D7E464
LPLRAAAGGVHVRLGFAEAAADLARAAGAGVAAAGAVLLGPSGELAGRIEAEEFARRHGLVRVSARAVRDYRRRTEPQVERAAVADLPTAAGRFRALGYRGTSGSATPGAEHVVLVAGALGEPEPVPLHVHAECLTGDVLGSTACGCRRTWADALARIGGTGRGVLVYHRSPHAQACGLRPDPGTNDAAWTAAAVLADLGVDAVLPVGLDPAAAEVLSAFGVGVSSEFCAAVG